MKVLMAMVGVIALYSLVIAQTAAEVIPPVASLLGLLGLMIKYIRDNRVENAQQGHYENLLKHQKETYENTISDLRYQVKELHKQVNYLQNQIDELRNKK